MNKEPEFHIAEKDPSAIIEGKFNDPIWEELKLLLVGGDEKLTPEKVEYLVLEVNMEVNHVLEMIIMDELDKIFTNQLSRKELPDFIKKLNSTGSGIEQIELIDKEVWQASELWIKVEKELVKKCLNPLVIDIKAAEAEDFVRNRELREEQA